MCARVLVPVPAFWGGLSGHGVAGEGEKVRGGGGGGDGEMLVGSLPNSVSLGAQGRGLRGGGAQKDGVNVQG